MNLNDLPLEELQYRASAALQLRDSRHTDKTVYGIHSPTGELLRAVQDVGGGTFEEVDHKPIVMVPEKLERFVTIPKRFKVAFGGRSGTKSMTFADILASRAKDYGEKTLCIRELQNSIEDSVHALLKAEIDRLGFPGFEITDKAIRIEGEDVFKFKGMGRNTDAVKSMYGFERAWAEEAQSLSFKSISTLTPTIREAGSELWFSLNPGSSADPMSQRFLKPFYTQLLKDGYYEDELHLIVWINYTDNPWHSHELEMERIYDDENLSRAAYNHKWLGHYDDEVDNALVAVEWFDAAIDAHVKLGFKPEGAIIAAHDPSDEGPDDKGYALRHGSVFLSIATNPNGDANQGMDWALERAVKDDADWFVWDCDGLGISLKRQVDTALAGKHIDYHVFKGSETADDPEQVYIDDTGNDSLKRRTNKETFANKRAQYYVKLADRFYKTYRAVHRGEYIDPDEMISLSSDIDCLDVIRSEVCRVPLKKNNNGKIQIMSKVEMARPPLSLPSPNLADSMMMAMFAPPAGSQMRQLKHTGWH